MKGAGQGAARRFQGILENAAVHSQCRFFRWPNCYNHALAGGHTLRRLPVWGQTVGSTMPKASLVKASLLVTGCSVALLVASNTGVAFAEPVHGPGSSHNPIVYHPVHGSGSSHNPIVVSTSKYPPGTVVRDHRHGKNCQYIVGDAHSIAVYRACEGYGR
jgi:hypothetical protein